MKHILERLETWTDKPGWMALGVPQEALDDLADAKAEIERLTADIERLWDALSWIDNSDPDMISAAEAQCGLDVRARTIKRDERK